LKPGGGTVAVAEPDAVIIEVHYDEVNYCPGDCSS